MADKRYLSWDEYMEMVCQLWMRLDMSARPFESFRAVPRGGLIPAVVLSHQLDTAYGGEFCPSGKAGRIGKPLDKHTVLVDDILDTGKTMMRVLRCTGLPSIIAVVVAKPQGVDAWRTEMENNLRPELWPELIIGHVHDGPEWIVFPYENQEKEERHELDL